VGEPGAREKKIDIPIRDIEDKKKKFFENNGEKARRVPGKRIPERKGS